MTGFSKYNSDFIVGNSVHLLKLLVAIAFNLPFITAQSDRLQKLCSYYNVKGTNMKKLSLFAIALMATVAANQASAHTFIKTKYYTVPSCSGSNFANCLADRIEKTQYEETHFKTLLMLQYPNHKVTITSNTCSGTKCVITAVVGQWFLMQVGHCGRPASGRVMNWEVVRFVW